MSALVVVVSDTPISTPTSLDPKNPADSIWVYFDFTAWLYLGVTVVSAVTTCIDPNGIDVSAAMISGSATILNSVRAKQLITGGILGNTYRLDCRGTFSDGQGETLSIDLPIGYTFGSPS